MGEKEGEEINFHEREIRGKMKENEENRGLNDKCMFY